MRIPDFDKKDVEDFMNKLNVDKFLKKMDNIYNNLEGEEKNVNFENKDNSESEEDWLDDKPEATAEDAKKALGVLKNFAIKEGKFGAKKAAVFAKLGLAKLEKKYYEERLKQAGEKLGNDDFDFDDDDDEDEETEKVPFTHTIEVKPQYIEKDEDGDVDVAGKGFVLIPQDEKTGKLLQALFNDRKHK